MPTLQSERRCKSDRYCKGDRETEKGISREREIESRAIDRSTQLLQRDRKIK